MTQSPPPQIPNRKLELKGDLGATSLAEVFEVIHLGRKTGVLHLNYANPLLNTKYSFHGGQLGRVLTPFVPRLREVMLELGAKPEQIQALKNPAIQQESDAGLPQGFLIKAVRLRLLRSLLPIVNDTQGTFELLLDNVPNGFIKPGVQPTSLLLDVATRMDELTDAGVTLHVADKVFMRHPEHAKEEVFEEQQQRVLDALVEPAPLQSLASQTGLAWDDLLKAMHALETQGMIVAEDATLKAISRRLDAGEKAPNFSLVSLDGHTFSLGHLRGKTSLVAFFRFASCPVCDLRIHELIKNYENLQQHNISVVAIFGSSLENLRSHVGKHLPPFPVLSDEGGFVHERYGVEKSMLGVMDPRNMPAMIKGMMKSGMPAAAEGQMTRMPAEFLLGPDLKIQQARYGRFLSDHISIDELLQWT